MAKKTKKPLPPIIQCKDCGEEMKYIYDRDLRHYCHECLDEMRIEYAKDILGYSI